MKFGKTKVEINVEGCYGCGIRWSHAWGVAKAIKVKVAKTEYDVELPICGDCMAAKQGGQLELSGVQVREEEPLTTGERV